MAFFRVQTNQLQVPLEELRVPGGEGDTPEKAGVQPKTPNEKARQRSLSEASVPSEDELPVLEEQGFLQREGERELTSSAVKGRAISGLLELSRG
jgi:hypothetical protein